MTIFCGKKIAAGRRPLTQVLAPEVAVQQQHQVMSEGNLVAQLHRSQSFRLFCGSYVAHKPCRQPQANIKSLQVSVKLTRPTMSND